MTLYKEFTLSSKGAFAAFKAFLMSNVAACAESDHPLHVIVTTAERKRNSEQNKRYWAGTIAYIAEQAWVNGDQFSRDAWHEMYARKFGTVEEVRLPNGEIVSRRKSTTEMTVGEFSEYIQAVEADAAANFGVIFE